MPAQPGLAYTFNTAVDAYDRCRPTYPAELYHDLFSYMSAPPAPGMTAVEIGIGTGQATRPILDAGCTVAAVELGDAMTAFVRQKFSDCPNFSCINQPFEETGFPPSSCDLVYSASAFHWIPEEIGYKKVFDMLRPGGVFARFANHPYYDPEQPELFDAMQKVYAVYMPGSRPGGEYTAEQAMARAEIAGKYGFCDIGYRLYHRTRMFSADDYIALLGTYSDHIAIPQPQRTQFFSGLYRVISAFGGITLFDTIDLQLARKPL
ncbi:MAG: class I SAM-dependent methyltransferase [Ruminococcaceae bacterium]|nr:class I SAM-dependent methyltransferase [Oscillospiraceae bacterium]